ncbi:hypothetical protein BDFG_02218 [Blastomyces dermatitidis ATCC 26199]|nr:hypothetical protein BDFG_02218 [Blastomyces dermatitidis ATCC 26199]
MGTSIDHQPSLRSNGSVVYLKQSTPDTITKGTRYMLYLQGTHFLFTDLVENITQ